MYTEREQEQKNVGIDRVRDKIKYLYINLEIFVDIISTNQIVEKTVACYLKLMIENTST